MKFLIKMLLSLIVDKIQFYVLILTVLIGIPGNVISILIFIKPCLTNTGLLYTLLCILNLVAIIYNVFVTYSSMFFIYEILLPLRTELFIGYIQLQFLAWSQVIITFDRFIAVVYPIKGVRIMSKKWILYLIILAVFIAIIGLNCPYFIRFPIQFTVFNQTVTSDNLSYEMFILVETVKISMEIFIPYLIMVILDIIVIIRLRNLKRNLSERQNTNANNKSSKFTRNTILIDLVYLIFNLPTTIFHSFITFSQIIPMWIELTPYFDFLFNIFILFPYIYASLLFFMFIIFNKIFSSEFVSMLNQQKSVFKEIFSRVRSY